MEEHQIVHDKLGRLVYVTTDVVQTIYVSDVEVFNGKIFVTELDRPMDGHNRFVDEKELCALTPLQIIESVSSW